MCDSFRPAHLLREPIVTQVDASKRFRACTHDYGEVRGNEYVCSHLESRANHHADEHISTIHKHKSVQDQKLNYLTLSPLQDIFGM